MRHGLAWQSQVSADGETALRCHATSMLRAETMKEREWESESMSFMITQRWCRRITLQETDDWRRIPTLPGSPETQLKCSEAELQSKNDGGSSNEEGNRSQQHGRERKDVGRM